MPATDDILYGEHVTKIVSIDVENVKKILDDCAEKYNLQKSYHSNLEYFQISSHDDRDPYLIIVDTNRTNNQGRITVRAETKERADQIAQKVVDRLIEL